MKTVRRHIDRLAVMAIALFALQGIGIGYCAAMPMPVDGMAPGMHAMHSDEHTMSMAPCMADKMPSSQTSSCEHCNSFDMAGLVATGTVSPDKAPQVAILLPARPADQSASRQSHDFPGLHGPPRSSSLIYSTSLRILR